MKLRFKRRSVIVCLTLLGCGGGGAATSTGLPAGPLARPFTKASVNAAVELLARNGIATMADESSPTPMVAVTAPNGMQFTRAQVRSMALGAADGGGVAGAALDAATPMPAGAPPVSYLLASWVSQAATPAAAAMSMLMGTQDWQHAPTIDFPTIALPLFVADVIAALPAATATTNGVRPFDLTIAPCSTASNFIQNVINSVFAALQLTAPAGTGVVATVGGFLVNLWNGAVNLAQMGAEAVISAVTAPILGAIKTVAGTAFVISQVVSYVTPWSVSVTADPSSVTAGGGGSVTAAVDTGTGGATYPPAVQDCANALGVTLPALTAATASAVWSLTSPISATDGTSVTLDSKGASTIGFTSSSSSQAATCPGTPAAPPETGSATITVTRPGIDGLSQLVTTMVTNGFGVAGSIVGPAIQAILGPIVASIVAQLQRLAEVSGTGYVTVKAAPPSPAANCPPNPSGTACIFGSWTVTSLTSPALNGGAGVLWTVGTDGTIVVDYDGSAPLIAPGGEAYTYAGSATYQTTLPADPTGSTGTYVATPTSQDVTATYVDVMGNTVTEPITETAHPTTWTCTGDALTLSSDASGYSFVYALSRVGG
jgi:hypothetical protein